MNKIVTGAMMMMGVGMAMGAGYYLGLPKNKKKELTNKAKEILPDKNFLEEMK